MSALSISGISEIVLSVRDLDRMKSFYQEVLGFGLVNETSFDRDGNRVPDGAPTISFLKISDIESPVGQRCHPQVLVLIDHRRHPSGRVGHAVETSTLHHLAFEIPHHAYDGNLAKLRKLALDPREVAFPAIHAKSIFFEDPEGNSLELICPDSSN
ncbi:MAG: hypothetical protein SynsKO_09510 [Synoicihabitans sp.]